MNYSLRRLLLVFVLLIAIPFQGVASTLMFACEMSHGLSPVVSAHEHGSHATEHAHASSDAQSPGDLVGFGLDDHHSNGSDPHKNHLKYNSCGSSSASGAVANTEVFLASPVNHRTEFNYVSSLHLPPVLAGLDRPPRRAFA